MEKHGVSRNIRKLGKMRQIAVSSCSLPILVPVFETVETTVTGDTRSGEAVLAAAAD